jgi:hypothetical protein
MSLRTMLTLESSRASGGLARRETREARLRPEYVELYPGIRSGEWEPAAILADRLLADRLLRGSDAAIRGRVLLDAHFEFRGGASLGGERDGMRLRRESVPETTAHEQ